MKHSVVEYICFKGRYGIKFLLPCLLLKINKDNAYLLYLKNKALKSFYKNMTMDQIKKEIEKKYYYSTHVKMDIDYPHDLNEYIQWNKINDIERKKELADKYEVRKYIKAKVGQEHLIKLIGIYDNFEEINFAALTYPIVIKSTQGCGFNMIIRDRSQLNYKKIQKKFKWWMKIDYAYEDLELQYDINKTRIIIEECIEDFEEYKFMCFNGKPEFFWIRSSQNGVLTRNFFDMKMSRLGFHFGEAPEKDNIIISPFINSIIADVMKLATGYNLVRIDTYVTPKNYYFGEITFTSGSGTDDWKPKEESIRFGNFLGDNHYV